MQIQLDSFSRSETLCTTGEATERQSASGLHIGMVLATIIGLQHESLWVGTSNNNSEVRQGSRSTRNSIRTVATWVRCLILSVHRPCHPVVTCKLQKTCSWTSDEQPSKRSREHAQQQHSTVLTSTIPMTLCKELETSVFRCQELLSKPVPAPETPFQPVPHGKRCT